MIRRTLISALLCGVASAALAADEPIRMPDGAVLGLDESKRAALIEIAIGPYEDHAFETLSAEGKFSRQVWTTAADKADTTLLAQSVRDGLEDAGYSILYECETRVCGGFDFRFELDVAHEPAMHVDLGDFRYLAAAKVGEGTREYITVMVSRSPNQGFIQLTHIGDGDDVEADIALSTKTPDAETTLVDGALADELLAKGSMALEGLEFEKGSAELSGSPADSLQDLADFLQAAPGSTVILVGHTDASGSLEGNIALSKRRAEAVMKRLIETYGVSAAQVTAEGVGYLSPRASNATAEGRLQNRRVEVVLTSLE